MAKLSKGFFYEKNLQAGAEKCIETPELSSERLSGLSCSLRRRYSLEAAVLTANFSLCLHYQPLAILTWASSSKQWREKEMIDPTSLWLKTHLLVNKLQSGSREKRAGCFSAAGSLQRGAFHDPEISDERKISGICVFEEGEGCGGGVGVTSQGHYNSLRSHHSCGVFMSDGLFAWIGFLEKHSGRLSTGGGTQNHRGDVPPALS